MLTDMEVKIESQITDLENIQAARTAYWLAEKARTESKLESRRAAWLVEQTGRNAKIAALRARLLAKREVRFARKKELDIHCAEIKENAARRERFFAAFTPDSDLGE